MSLVSSFIAAAEAPLSQIITATAAPLGAAKAAGAAIKKGAAPGPGATLSPDVMKLLQNSQFGLHKSPLATNAPWLTHTFAGLFIVCAVGLIFLLAVQTTKQEGLSGTIGGRVESAYRPRLGFDQQLQRLTGVIAVGMVFFGVILSITGI